MENKYESSAKLINNYLIEQNKGNFLKEDYENKYEQFKNKFSPEILKQLEGEDILNYIFVHDGDKNNLCYNLEFSNDYNFAGGIGGGSAYKYTLFKSNDVHQWISGPSKKNSKIIDENEAITIGTKIRNALVNGAECIKKSELETVKDYITLENKLNEIFEDVDPNPTSAWIHKYYVLIFPDKFPTMHAVSMKKNFLKNFNITPEETYYGIDGQFYILSKKSNIKIYSLFDKNILNLFINKSEQYLSIDEWVESLENENLINDKMLSVLEIIYNYPNQTASTYEIAEERLKIGFENEKSYNADIHQNSKRVKEHFNKKPIFRTNGKEEFWSRFFYGENKKNNDGNNVFYFTLREELIEALKTYDKTKREIKTKKEIKNIIKSSNDSSFYDYLINNGYYFNKETIENYLLSLKVKPFVILTGNSGTGKTKLAQLFAQYLNQTDNYKIIPVGANWTENRHILGYFNILKNEPQYTPAYYLIEKSQSESYPHFLILDEMNLSHVERYFADFLSAIESNENIPLHGEEELEIPSNLFIIGTVNVDETTYMFSPKVLDRANTIEFETYNAKNYMNNNFNSQKPKGNIEYLEDIMQTDNIQDMPINELKEFFNNDEFWNVLSDEILKFQDILKESGFDFGFRVINEITRFMAVAYTYENNPSNWNNWERYFDAQIKQKMLPKLHGSQKVIGETLDKLLEACENYPTSKAKLEEMISVLEKQRYVSFIN